MKILFYHFAAIFVGTILALSSVGCKQNTRWPESPANETVVAKGNTDGQLPEKYNDYLVIMNVKERRGFFEAKTDNERDRYIKSQGIDKKKYLQDTLKTGMPIEKVENMRELGKPIKTTRENSPGMSKSEWIYDTFNGYRNVRYALAFHNGKLAGWRLWLP